MEMQRDFEITDVPTDPRPIAPTPDRRVVNRKGFKITPSFIPDGWRVLRPREEVEDGDYRWKKTSVTFGHYIPATKIGDLVGHPITYIRRI